MSSFKWLVNPATLYFIKKPLIALAVVFAVLLIVSVLLVVCALKREKRDD